MFIIVYRQSYYSGSDEFGNRYHNREFAKQFETKQLAQSEKEKYNIQGSIIPL